MESVRENNVIAAEWGKHAEFIRQLADHNLSEDAVSQITGPQDASQP
ncbi:hypothetical protein [Mesorhizobium sp.]|nr:hypothetical protein [Mesorhizobium sp.]